MDNKEFREALEGKALDFSDGRKPEDYETFDDLTDEVFTYYYSGAKAEFKGQYRQWLSQGIEGYRASFDLKERLEGARITEQAERLHFTAEVHFVRWMKEGDRQALEYAGNLLRATAVITARMAALEEVLHHWLLYGHLDAHFVREQKDVPDEMRRLQQKAEEENISASDFGGKTTLFYDWCADVLNCARTTAIGRLQDWGIFVKGTQGKAGENLPLMIERLKEGDF